jgi:hypothetical protein
MMYAGGLPFDDHYVYLNDAKEPLPPKYNWKVYYTAKGENEAAYGIM